MRMSIRSCSLLYCIFNCPQTASETVPQRKYQVENRENEIFVERKCSQSVREKSSNNYETPIKGLVCRVKKVVTSYLWFVFLIFF